MMVKYGPPLLAFTVGFALALVELATSKYPRTFFLVARSRSLYAYAAIYGLLACVVMVLLNTLMASEIVRLEGFGLGNPWWKAVFVGITVKAFFHIRLFSVGVGTQTVPVGVETIVQLFEPWLLRSIDIDHFNSVRELLSARAQAFPDLTQVRTRIKASLPMSFGQQDRAAFQADVDRTTTVEEAMELFLAYLGKRAFDRVFPPRP